MCSHKKAADYMVWSFKSSVKIDTRNSEKENEAINLETFRKTYLGKHISFKTNSRLRPGTQKRRSSSLVPDSFYLKM